MDTKLSIEDLVEDILIEFTGPEKSDYYFFQKAVNYLVKRLNNVTVTCNGVIFYGSYTTKISGRSVKIHFTNGKFTHLTSDQRNLSQTYNKKSFE
jgi:hypothetical protein